MEKTPDTKMGQFFGAQNSDKLDSIIEDKNVRKALIDASIKMENMLAEEKINLAARIVSKTEWGLNIEIEMSQPKEDKPVIFQYTYTIDRVAYQQWVDEHTYLLEGDLMGFTSRGIKVFIPEKSKAHKIFVEITIKYAEDALNNVEYRPNILEENLVLVVHREVVSNHDWIVKCVVP